jgi:hypothetical protein
MKVAAAQKMALTTRTNTMFMPRVWLIFVAFRFMLHLPHDYGK